MSYADEAFFKWGRIDGLIHMHALRGDPDGVIYDDDAVCVECHQGKYSMTIKKTLEVCEPRYCCEVKGFTG